MARALIELPKSVFIARLFAGERDFSRTKFVGDPNTAEETGQINAYMKTQDLAYDPLILDLADLSGVQAPCIYVPHTRARGVKATGLYMPDSYLQYADLGVFTHPGGSKTRSDLRHATFDKAQMQYCSLNGAKVFRTKFMFTNLWDASMEDLMDLEKALYLDSAIMRPEQRDKLHVGYRQEEGTHV